MVAGGAAYDVVVVGSGDRGVAAPLRGARWGTDLYAPAGPYLAPAAGERPRRHGAGDRRWCACKYHHCAVDGPLTTAITQC